MDGGNTKEGTLILIREPVAYRSLLSVAPIAMSKQ